MAEGRYLETIPLVDEPDFMAYMEQTHTLFLAYANKRITQIALNPPSLQEQHLVNTPVRPIFLGLAGTFLFASGDRQSYLYDTGGAQVEVFDYLDTEELAWDPNRRRIYTMEYDVEWYEIDETGGLVQQGAMPFQNNFHVFPPLHLSPDYSLLLLGSGVILDSDQLEFHNTLANNVKDAQWTAEALFTISARDNGTQIQKWVGNGYEIQQSHLFRGEPLGLFRRDSDLTVVTGTPDGPQFYKGDLNFSGFAEPEFPMIHQFTASATTILAGETVDLSWSVTGATTVLLNSQRVGSNGTKQISPTHHSIYTLTATGLGDPIREVLQIEVNHGAETYGIQPPHFISHENFWLDDMGHLQSWFPDPNSDGAGPEGGPVPTYYNVSVRQNCVEYFQFSVYLENGDAWPQTFTLPGNFLPPGAYQIAVARYSGTGSESDNRSDEVVITGPTGLPVDEGPPVAVAAFNRWLLHVPKRSGGFGGRFKIENLAPQANLPLYLVGFDSSGQFLKAETMSMLASQTAYFDLYGELGLFSGFEDQVSHIGIYDPADIIKVSLRFSGLESQFGAWVEETDFRKGNATGATFDLEGRGSESFQDGLAVLNLTTNLPIRVFLVHRDSATNLHLEEVDLGELAPGAKMLHVASDYFDFRPDSKYTVETRDPSHQVQVMGMVFSGGDFFAPTPVYKR